MAFAQPGAMKRVMPKVKPQQNPHQGDSNAPPPAPPPNICPSRRAILDQERQRLDSYKAELSSTEAEQAALQRRIDELNRRKNDLKNLVKGQESRVAQSEATWKKECTSDETCERYETAATDLDVRSAAVERDLDAVRQDIATQSRAVADLRARIEPLQREYAEKQCNNLVPGATEQSTIDRCSAIFSDWNRLQADLNRQNNRMLDMRSRYEQLMSELRSLESRGASIATYLTQKCTSSPKGQVVKNVEGRRQRGQTVGQELDKLIEDIKTLRGVTITVTTK
jgi:chromosome segregation ATPase